MQKLFFILIACFLALPSQAQVLKCNVEDPPFYGSTVTLSALRGNLETEVAQTTIDQNGHFEFSRVGLEEGYYRLALNKNQYVDLIFSDAEPVIDITFKSSNLGKSAYINQSTENFAGINWALLFESNMKSINDLKRMRRDATNDKDRAYAEASIDSFWVYEQDQLESMLAKYPNTFFSRVTKSYRSNSYQDYLSKGQSVADVRNLEKISAGFFDHVDFNDEALINSPALKDMVWRYINNYIKRNNSVAVFRAIDRVMDQASVNENVYNFCLEFMLESVNRTGPKVVFQYLVEEYLLAGACVDDMALDDGVKLLADVYNSLLPGNVAPNTVIKSYDGLSYNVADEAAKANATILYFWSSHCNYCSTDLPELKRMYQRFEKKGLKIVGVSVDTDIPEYQSALKEKAMPWTSICEGQGWAGPTTDLYKIHKTPAYYIFDANMKIIAKPGRSKDIESTLLNILGE